jgi:hypothetical protein
MKHSLTIIFSFVIALNIFTQQQDTIAIDTLMFQIEPLPTFENLMGCETKERIIEIQTFETEKTTIFFWWMLLFLSTVLIAVWNLERQYSLHLAKSVFSLNHSLQIIRTERFKDRFLGVFYSLIFLILLSVGIQYYTAAYFQSLVEWYKIAFVIGGYNIVENFIARASGYLINKSNLSRASIFNKQALRFILLILMLPLIFLIIFSDGWIHKILVTSYVSIFVLFFLIKEIKNFQLLLMDRINVISLHFFIYLCTFKILPIIFLVKILYAYI